MSLYPATSPDQPVLPTVPSLNPHQVQPGWPTQQFKCLANHAIIRSSSSWQLIISLAAHPSACLEQLHISTAFLNNVLTKDLNCRLPPLTTCRMLNSLFASNKPPTALLKMGLTNDDSDQGLFIQPMQLMSSCGWSFGL